MLWSRPTYAEIGAAWRADLELASEYTHRGISRSDRKPSALLQVARTAWSGPEFSVAAQTVDFNVPAPEHGPEFELKAQVAWRRVLSPALEWSLGGAGYRFPGAPAYFHYHYAEVYGILEYEGLRAALYFTPDYFAGGGRTWHADISSARVWGNYTLALHVGAQHSVRREAFAAGDDSGVTVDVTLAASRLWGRVQLGLALIGTSLDREACYIGQDWCAPRLLFSVSSGF